MAIVEHHGDATTRGVTQRIEGRNNKGRIALALARVVIMSWTTKAAGEPLDPGKVLDALEHLL